MPRLPERPNIDHLKKQARELLRLYETGDPAALARSRKSLPRQQTRVMPQLSRSVATSGLALGYQLCSFDTILLVFISFPSAVTLVAGIGPGSRCHFTRCAREAFRSFLGRTGWRAPRQG
jgi:hypothetical protein